MSPSHGEERFADDLQQVAEVLRDRRATLDPLALDAIKLRAMSRAHRSTSSQQKGFFMRSRLATVLTIAFLGLGTGGALALSGGQDFGLGGHAGHSASASQYGHPPVTPPGPPVTTPPVTPPGPPATTPPVPAPPVRTPPASQFQPHAASAKLSTQGAATIHCAVACHIVVRASRGSHRVRLAKRLGASGTATVRLSKSALRRLGRGRVVLIVEVDGKQVAKRTVQVS
jgi:hypothetical protein